MKIKNKNLEKMFIASKRFEKKTSIYLYTRYLNGGFSKSIHTHKITYSSDYVSVYEF